MNDHERHGFFESDRGHKLLLLVVLAAAAWLYLDGIGSYSLWDPWEPKYAQSVREMRERGDFLTPYHGGKIRWTKPILVYWAMGASTFVLGDNELAVRLPSALAAIAGLLVLYYFLRRLRGRRTALIGTCVLGTIPQYFFLARQAVPDMLFTVFLCAAMGFFALGRFGTERKRLYFGLFYASVGLATMTKGPAACAIVALAVVIFWIVDIDPRRLVSPSAVWSDFRSMLRSYHVGLGFVIFVAVIAPWYGAMLFEHGYTFIDRFFVDENIKRFGQPLFGHEGETTSYLLPMIHGMFPWISLLPLGVMFLFHGRDRLDDEVRQRWFYVSWILSIFAIFSAASTKLDHYIFPMTPAVAVLVALAWESYYDRSRPYWVRPVFLMSLVFALLPVRDFLVEGNGFIMNVFIPYQDIEIGWEQIDLAIMIIAGAWTLVIVSALFHRSRLAFVLATLVAFGNGVYFTHHVMPIHTPERNLQGYAELYHEVREPDAVLVYYGWIRFSTYYYLGKDEFHYFEPDQLARAIEFVQDRPNVYIIAQERFFDALLTRLHDSTEDRWTTVSEEHPLFRLIRRAPVAAQSSTGPGRSETRISFSPSGSASMRVISGRPADS